MPHLSGNQRPDPLTSLTDMSLVLHLPLKCIFPDPPQMPHACHAFWKCHKTLTFLFIFDKVRNPLRRPRDTTSEHPKVLRTRYCFTLLASTCASRHNGVHLFDFSTSKSGPNMVCCVHFDFQMCFAPQLRALFRHLNFQKWSNHEVLCTC